MSKQQNPEPVRRGFPGLPCLKCGERDTVHINLKDLSCECEDCQEEWSIAHVAQVVRLWLPVAEWLFKAPPVEE